MATALIRSGALIGAYAGLVSGRALTAGTAAAYASAVLAASSFADQVEASCAAVSFADADVTNAYELVSLVANMAQSIMLGRNFSSVTDADYTVAALACAASSKAMAASLT
jgi:hypothetical protein